MKIRWDYNRKKWMIWPGDINEGELAILSSEMENPGYWDNWDDGDVYFYRGRFPIGELIQFCNDNGLKLEILY